MQATKRGRGRIRIVLNEMSRSWEVYVFINDVLNDYDVLNEVIRLGVNVNQGIGNIL